MCSGASVCVFFFFFLLCLQKITNHVTSCFPSLMVESFLNGACSKWRDLACRERNYFL